MITAEISVAGTIDTTVPSPGDPTYQTECASLEWRQTMKNLKDAGFVFSRAEASDFTDYSNDVKDFIDKMALREDEILTQGFSDIAADLPDVLSIIAAISSGGLSEVPAILLNAMLSRLAHGRDSQIEHAEGEPLAELDLSQLVAVLQNVFQDDTSGISIFKKTADTNSFAQLVSEFKILFENIADFIETLDDSIKLAFIHTVAEEDYPILREVLSDLTINLLSDEYQAYFQATQTPDAP